MDARGVDRFTQALVQPLDVRGAELALHRVHDGLVPDHFVRNLAIAGRERAHRELEVLDHLRVQIRDLVPALRGENVIAPDLLFGELHEVLVDDIADLLEIHDHEDERGLALRLLLGERMLPQLHEVLLDVLLEPVDEVVARDDLAHERDVVAFEYDSGLAERLKDDVTHAEDFAEGLAQRDCRRVEDRRI